MNSQPDIQVDVFLQLLDPIRVEAILLHEERHLLDAPVVLIQVHDMSRDSFLQQDDLVSIRLTECDTVGLADLAWLQFLHDRTKIGFKLIDGDEPEITANRFCVVVLRVRSRELCERFTLESPLTEAPQLLYRG